MHELRDDMAQYLSARPGSGVKNLAEIVAFNNSDEIEMQYFGQEYFELALELGGRTADYRKLREANLDWAKNKVLGPAFEKFDILIGETYAPAWTSKLGQGDDYSSATWISMAPAIACTPIGALPMGIADGLPVAVGVLARANQEALLIQAMAEIEKVLDLGVLQPTFLK